jgi:hypothetical protein
MESTMLTLVGWIEGTAISMLFQAHEGWLWPLCETVHFVGLGLVIGMAGLFDLRLLGAMPQVRLSSAHAMLRWAGVGLLLNLVTGSVFIITDPRQYLTKGVFWAKIAFLLVAAANALIFERMFRRRAAALAAEAEAPAWFRTAGAISLAAWFGVLYCGRMIPYLP